MTRTEILSQKVDQEPVMDVAVSPGTNWLAWVSFTALGLMNLQTGETNLAPTERHLTGVCQLRFSPGGEEIALGRNNRVMIFGLEDRNLKPFATSDGNILVLAYSPDGELLTAGDELGWVALWDRRTGQRLFHDRAHSSRPRVRRRRFQMRSQLQSPKSTA